VEEVKQPTGADMNTSAGESAHKATATPNTGLQKGGELKDVALDKAREVKDSAAHMASELKRTATDKLHAAEETASEAFDDVRYRAGRVGRSTWSFAVANAAPLALLGIGAGWLIANSRGGRSEGRWQRYEPRRGVGDFDYAPEAYESRAGNGANLTAGVGSRAKDVYDRAGQSLRSAEHTVARSAARARDQVTESVRRARDASRDYAEDNPLMIGFATLVAGVGVGLLLPRTAREEQLLAPVRDKVGALVADVRHAADEVGEVARETAKQTANVLG
jgi:ElaB/YqjD/DUF883 family membrane-anchored ribosome-binding protein